MSGEGPNQPTQDADRLAPDSSTEPSSAEPAGTDQVAFEAGVESAAQKDEDTALNAAGAGDAVVSSDSEADEARTEGTAGASDGSDLPLAGGASDGAPSQADVDAALSAASEEAEVPASASADAQQAGEGGSPATSADGSPKPDSTGHPLDETAAMMEAAVAEERVAVAAAAGASQSESASGTPLPQESPPSPAGSVPLELPDFGGSATDTSDDRSIELLNDVELNVKIELGRSQMVIEDVLRLGEGSVVELDKLAGDPVDVLVNEKLVARGEVLVLNDNFCVRISEIVAGLGQPDES